MQELDVQPLIDAGLFPSLISVLYRLISSSISPGKQAIACISGHSPIDSAIHPSRTSTVQAERPKSAGSCPAVNDKVFDAGIREVSPSPGLEAADTDSVIEKPPLDSGDKQSNEEVASLGDTVLEEPKLAGEDDDETSDLVEGAPLDEHLANKEAEVSVSMPDEVSMEDKRALVYNYFASACFIFFRSFVICYLWWVVLSDNTSPWNRYVRYVCGVLMSTGGGWSCSYYESDGTTHWCSTEFDRG